MNKLYIVIFVMGLITASINSANGILAGQIGLLESVVIIHIIGLLMSSFYYFLFEKDKSRSLISVFKSKPYLLAGGLIGSVAVVSISYAVQNIGVFLVSTALVSGQFIFSFFVDINGWFGFEKVPLTRRKMTSIGLMMAGVLFLMI